MAWPVSYRHSSTKSLGRAHELGEDLDVSYLYQLTSTTQNCGWHQVPARMVRRKEEDLHKMSPSLWRPAICRPRNFPA
jgi:hypothetical protein